MSKNYLDNKAFEETIKNYLVDKKPSEDKLTEFLLLLINNILNTFTFTTIDREDVAQECFILLLRKLHKFEPGRGTTAFNYFSTVIFNQVRLMYSKNKTYTTNLGNYKSLQEYLHQPDSAR